MWRERDGAASWALILGVFAYSLARTLRKKG